MPQEKQSTQPPEPSKKRASYEGWSPDVSAPEKLAEALEIAVDYRGDVTIKLKSGTVIEGYLFNRVTNVPKPFVEIYPKNEEEKKQVFYHEIAGLTFSKIDPAAGRSWESWVKKWEEKQKALAEGRDIGDIEPKPMPLDD